MEPSIWKEYAEIYPYPQLQQNLTVEAAVIGGGITGISVGKLLGEAGISTVVLESHTVGSGTTSHSTGNLYYTVDVNLSALASKYDINTVKNVASSRSQALQRIRHWIEDLNLDCDYKQVPWFFYSSDEKNEKSITKELSAGNKAELSLFLAGESEIPFPHTTGITIPDQAQINPMRYVQELAKTINGSCQIYEHSRVYSVEHKQEQYVLHTPGGVVTANKVIHATHSPKGVKFVQTLLGPYREYGIACTINGTQPPEGIFWGLYEGGKVISTRTYNRKGESFLIVVGEPHKVGHKENNEQNIKSLERFSSDHFKGLETVFRWGGQHYRPADLLPYIGPVKEGSKEFIATGYSTDGLIYGTLSAIILKDLITGQKNNWTKLYDSTRKQPLKSGPKFIKENIGVASHLIKDLTGPKDSSLEDLEAGDGKIVKKDGKRLAVSRNEKGELETVSAVCTHMGCNVHWNHAEKTWDCPCHGSRFTTDGTVIEGPAFKPLQKNPADL